MAIDLSRCDRPRCTSKSRQTVWPACELLPDESTLDRVLEGLPMDAYAVATGKKIPVVEDDLNGAGILEAYVRRGGFLIAVSHDGEHALHLHCHWGPDLVLLDIKLPKKGRMHVPIKVRPTALAE